jgi:hypothetical protein
VQDPNEKLGETARNPFSVVEELDESLRIAVYNWMQAL